MIITPLMDTYETFWSWCIDSWPLNVEWSYTWHPRLTLQLSTFSVLCFFECRAHSQICFLLIIHCFGFRVKTTWVGVGWPASRVPWFLDIFLFTPVWGRWRWQIRWQFGLKPSARRRIYDIAWIQIVFDFLIRLLHLDYTIRWYGPFIKFRNGHITMTWSIKPHYQGVHWQWCRIWTCSTIGYLNGVPLPSWVDRGYRGVLGVLRSFSRLLVGYWVFIHYLPSFNSTPHELSAPSSSPSWTVFIWIIMNSWMM